MVLLWDFSRLGHFMWKAAMGGRPADPHLHQLCWDLKTGLPAVSAGGKLGLRAVSSSAQNVLSGVSEPPWTAGATSMCSRSPAHWSLAPVRHGEGTCSPRWKRCQTASCGKDPSSAAQLGFTSADFLCLIFVLSFFHSGAFPMHQFLNILWGTLLAR